MYIFKVCSDRLQNRDYRISGYFLKNKLIFTFDIGISNCFPYIRSTTLQFSKVVLCCFMDLTVKLSIFVIFKKHY